MKTTILSEEQNKSAGSTVLYYQGTQITVNACGWVNASQMGRIRSGSNAASEWLVSSCGLSSLERVAGLLGASFPDGFFDLARVRRDRQNFLRAMKDGQVMVMSKAGDTDKGGGLWLHPDLALDFARWVDADQIEHPLAGWLAKQLPKMLKQSDEVKKARHDAEAQDLVSSYADVVSAGLLEQLRAADAVLVSCGCSAQERQQALADLVNRKEEV